MSEFVEYIELPFRIKVYSYTPGRAAQVSGPPEACYPADPEEIEWAIVDEVGNEMEYIMRMLSDQQRETIEAGIIERYEDARYEEISKVMGEGE